MDGESDDQREYRLRTLWNKLDVKRKGYLDLAGLKSGLAQMNHREQHHTYTVSSTTLSAHILYKPPKS